MPRRNGGYAYIQQWFMDRFLLLLVLTWSVTKCCVSLRMKIQNAEQDQGHRLAREEFHSSLLILPCCTGSRLSDLLCPSGSVVATVTGLRMRRNHCLLN